MRVRTTNKPDGDHHAQTSRIPFQQPAPGLRRGGFRTASSGAISVTPIGYLYKRVQGTPEWLDAPGVVDVFSVSNCVSEDFADYVSQWKHNGYWLFDSPAVMKELALELGISLEGMELFYYEAYELQFDADDKTWSAYEPEASLGVSVIQPMEKTLEGYDIVSYCAGSAPECSPLSCNACAKTVPTNEHCLLASFEDARFALESGALEGSEPGPYRIIAVYSTHDD